MTRTVCKVWPLIVFDVEKYTAFEVETYNFSFFQHDFQILKENKDLYDKN